MSPPIATTGWLIFAFVIYSGCAMLVKAARYTPIAPRTPSRPANVRVRNEPLERGQRGERIEVVDYGPQRLLLERVDLEDTRIAMQDGLDPSAAAPRFHHQMVYAVAMEAAS